jgi:hypothetical protein
MTGDIISLNGIGFYMANQALGGSTYCNYTWSGIQLSSATSALVIQPDGITFPGGGISKQTVAYPGAAILYDNAALTGNPTAPTQATSENSTRIATTAFVKAQGYLTSAPVTSVAGRTGAVTLSNTDISGLGSLAVVNDAPSDGSQYARQDGAWSIVSAGGSYLPLAGGALDANASITASDTGTTTDSELAGWGLGVQLTADHAQGTTVEFNGLNVYDSAGQMQVTPTGLTFPDSTVQSTAWVGSLGDYRPLIDYDFSNVADTKLTSFGMTLLPIVAETIPYDSYVSPDVIQLYSDFTYTQSQPGNVYKTYIDQTSVSSLTTIWDYDGNNDLVSDGGLGFRADTTGYFFTTASGIDSNTIRLYRNQLYFPTGTNLTGFPSTPTPSTSDNSTRIATTAFVKNQAYAPLASPVFTGDARAVTPAAGDNDTSIATTAFVQSAIIAGSAHAETLQATVRNNTGATLSPFTVVYINGALGNRATVAKAKADAESTSSGTFAITESSIANNADGVVISAGVLSNVDTSAYTDGDKLYLSPTTAGAVTTTKPSAPNHLVYIGVVTRSHPTLGTVSVRIQNGYELDELHDVAISSVANLDLLSYESSTSLWKNKSFSTLGLAGLASPTFTGTPSLPTGTTATTQTAGDNTTKLATTAFVTAAVPAFATNAETIVGTSSTKVLSPSLIPALITRPELRSFAHITQTAVQGSGTVTTGAVAFGQREMYLATLATGRAGFSYSIPGNNSVNMSRTVNGQINFSKKIWLAGKCMCGVTLGATNYNGDTNTFTRITLGGYNSLATGDMTLKGIGWKKQGGTSPYFNLTVHNGTTLTDVATTVQQSDGRTIDWQIYSDGAGNVTLYIDGVQAATTTAGPTGMGTTSAAAYREQVEATTAPAVRGIIESTGGWLYIEG